jgi:hypothetical protein
MLVNEFIFLQYKRIALKKIYIYNFSTEKSNQGSNFWCTSFNFCVSEIPSYCTDKLASSILPGFWNKLVFVLLVVIFQLPASLPFYNHLVNFEDLSFKLHHYKLGLQLGSKLKEPLFHKLEFKIYFKKRCICFTK